MRERLGEWATKRGGEEEKMRRGEEESRRVEYCELGSHYVVYPVKLLALPAP